VRLPVKRSSSPADPSAGWRDFAALIAKAGIYAMRLAKNSGITHLFWASLLAMQRGAL
jgi:hypothetical protein